MAGYLFLFECLDSTVTLFSSGLCQIYFEMGNLRHYIELIAQIIESAGVVVIAGGSMFFLIRYLVFLSVKKAKSFADLRRELGKAILLGLEILVAADIIATVTTEPTMNSVLVLAVIVLIRTFLSFSLQIELEGKFPWQKTTANKIKSKNV